MGDDDTAETVAYDKKYSPYKGAGRNEFLVVRSQEHTHDVGNNKSDETDHPRRVNGESHNEGADDVKEVDAAFRAELNNQKPVVVETVLSDKINVDFLKKVEKELLLDSKHVYLYVPAEGEDYTNVVTHLVNAGIVVILALSKAADLKIDGAEVLAGWESEVDATTVDVAAYIKKNA